MIQNTVWEILVNLPIYNTILQLQNLENVSIIIMQKGFHKNKRLKSELIVTLSLSIKSILKLSFYKKTSKLRKSKNMAIENYNNNLCL